MHFSRLLLATSALFVGLSFTAPLSTVPGSVANATAAGIDVYGSKASLWVKAQIDIAAHPILSKRQGYANIGIGMFAQDWCNGQGACFDDVVYGVNSYANLNMYSVGINYRGLRSNEQLDFSQLSGNDWCGRYLYSAGYMTPVGCFNSQAINCFRLTQH
ncbi:hypothetical protein MMC30_000376 [Trapelia coarctata]|nr:hypothetical protein [Trapelia coarctata]